MLHDSGLPKYLWGEAVQHATYLKNRSPMRALDDTTPYEVFEGTKPDLSNLVPWGSRVHVHDTSGSKLDARAAIGHWVGFDQESRAHRVYWPEWRIVTVERSVHFNIDDSTTVAEVPLAGERAPEAQEQPSPTGNTQDVLGSDFEPSRAECKRVRKPSAYIQRLRSGEGVTGG